MKKLLLLLVLFISVSCANTLVKKFGGTATTELKPNEKLVNITWKDSELWILTRPMTEKDSAVTYKFSEKSKLGIVEGTYVIVEVKE